MTGSRCAMAVAIGLGAMVFTGGARAQENLDAGKTGAQLFASDCQLCHKQPQGLSKAGGIRGLEHFLSLHYTDSEQTAALVANYLKSVDRNAASEPPRSTRKPRHSAVAPKPEGNAGAKAKDKGAHSKRKPGNKPGAKAA